LLCFAGSTKLVTVLRHKLQQLITATNAAAAFHGFALHRQLENVLNI